MNRSILWLFLFTGLLLTACRSNNVPVEPPGTVPEISVQITSDYCPSIEVQAGMQIAWTNTTDEDRTLLIEREDGQGAFVDTSGTALLPPGAEFSISFLEPGEYIYYCSEDRSTFGTITVSP